MNVFSQLGLPYYESKALEVLLHSSLSAKQIANTTNIPPGKVYNVLIALRKKGLIEETKSRPKQYYVEDPGETVKTLIQRKELETENIFAKARVIATSSSKLRNQASLFFQVGTTSEDNKSIQSRSFREARNEVCQIINIHHKPETNRTSKTLWEKEIKTAIERGVKFRCIYPKAAKLPRILQSLPADKFRVRRMDLDFVRCDIIDGNKVLVKLVNSDALNFGGVIFIEDETFARNLKSVFEQFWEEAKE